MKKTNVFFLLTLISLVFIQCEKDKKKDGDEPPGETSMEIYTNPTDPKLFTLTKADGTSYLFFGQKDVAGIPTQIEQINTTVPGISGDFIIKVDENSQPTRILAPNGTVFDLEWFDASNLRIHAISPNGKVQVNVPINLDSLNSMKYFRELPENPPNIRAGIPAVFDVKEKINTPQVGHLKNVKGNLNFQVIQCGEPVENAVVTVDIDPPIGDASPPASHTGGGNYTAQIPQANAEPADHEEECKKIADVINKICDKFAWIQMFGQEDNASAICPVLSTFIQDAFPDAGDDKQKIINMCNSAFTALPAICDYNDKNDMEYLCNLSHLLYDEPEQTTYKFSLSVSIPGQGTETTEWVEFDPNQPGTWDLDLGGEFGVQNLHTVPSDPAPSQGYTAYADIICPSASGTDVIISIVGTDGYTNSNTYTLTTNSEISLYVPGAAEGVQDIITVEANGQQWQISIVF